MKSILGSKTAGALLLGAAMIALISTEAAAQSWTTMPSAQYDPYSWMIMMNNISNQQVNQMLSLCMSNPGACNGLANQQTLEGAFNAVQQQSLNDVARTQQNMQDITRSISNTDCALTGGQVLLNPATQQYDCYRF
jgi:hypothetical protein